MADMMDELFSGIDDLKDDLIEFGVLGAAAVGGHVAVGYAMKYAGSYLPSWANALAAIAGGVAVGKWGGKYVPRNLAKGVAIGMVAAGVGSLVKEFSPVALPGLAGLGDGIGDDDLLMGLGDGTSSAMYDRYLASAPVQVEERGSLSAAPMQIEESGLSAAPVQIEESALHGFDGLDSSLQ